MNKNAKSRKGALLGGKDKKEQSKKLKQQNRTGKGKFRWLWHENDFRKTVPKRILNLIQNEGIVDAIP